uniref:Ig-like domain-containing protein n=1 Tax=Oreochromis niloticus TaxID=8128 RepID=A0A669EZ24_ORENI
MTCSVFLLLFCIFVFPLLGQTTITAESGQDISLPCQVPANNEQVLAVQWSRADLKQEYVILYRDENRVDLQDRQRKDGDVSLILKNVTAADNGTYECRVFRRGTNHRISTISLSVVPPCELLKGRFCNRRLYLLHCFYSAFYFIIFSKSIAVLRIGKRTNLLYNSGSFCHLCLTKVLATLDTTETSCGH